MQPNTNKQPRPSLDGVRPAGTGQGGTPTQPTPVKPEYRYDHELPAPKQVGLLEDDHKPDLLLADENKPPKRKRSVKKILAIIFGALLIALLAAGAGAYLWYQQQLSPVTRDDSQRVLVKIVSGTAPSAIGDQLKEAGVIRSKLAFSIYTKLTNTENTLKAGNYNLQPSLSTQEVVEHLVSGKQDTFRVTFLPGDTLANNRKKLINLGFTEVEVDAALQKSYSGLLFTDKPAGADLEGYIYGETYEFDAAATVETILQRTFDEFQAVIEKNNLIAAFQKQNLTLYEGIILASIVQRESNGDGDDQRQIARVFLNRMEAGMTLGSDVTYQYIADKTGVTRDVNLDSPYNTRRYPGLPPGPIAAPSIGALNGVANPAANDYLFFLSGDDNVTYFARTDAEHQRNIVLHCQKKCQII